MNSLALTPHNVVAWILSPLFYAGLVTLAALDGSLALCLLAALILLCLSVRVYFSRSFADVLKGPIARQGFLVTAMLMAAFNVNHASYLMRIGFHGWFAIEAAGMALMGAASLALALEIDRKAKLAGFAIPLIFCAGFGVTCWVNASTERPTPAWTSSHPPVSNPFCRIIHGDIVVEFSIEGLKGEKPASCDNLIVSRIVQK